jgi:hypothetical protein
VNLQSATIIECDAGWVRKKLERLFEGEELEQKVKFMGEWREEGFNKDLAAYAETVESDTGYSIKLLDICN